VRHAWRHESPYGTLTVVVSDAGVAEITLPGADAPDIALGAADAGVARELDDWFAGRRHAFGVRADLDAVGGFRRLVLETLAREVGWGETVTYGELAELAGRPGAARAVGGAMRANPVPFVIPCHRVVAAGGRIGGYGGGRDAVGLKRSLLAREGVSTLR